MATQITPFLHLTEAIPGSNEPFSTAVVNGNFDAIDAFASNTNTRVGALETWRTATTPNLATGLIPSGTDAAKLVYWGAVPATAADRVALANKAPRWFNTDKGYMERYFAPVGDSATVGYNTLLARQNGGWLPEGTGLVPVNWGTLTAVGAGTQVANGNTLTFAASAGVSCDSVFTTDFDSYYMVLDITMSTSALLVGFMRTGGIDVNGAAAYNRQLLTGIGAAASASVATDNRFQFSHVATSGFLGTATLYVPAQTARGTFLDASSARADGSGRMSQSAPAGAHDGIKFVPNAGVITGTIRLYGYAGGHS